MIYFWVVRLFYKRGLFTLCSLYPSYAIFVTYARVFWSSFGRILLRGYSTQRDMQRITSTFIIIHPTFHANTSTRDDESPTFHTSTSTCDDENPTFHPNTSTRDDENPTFHANSGGFAFISTLFDKKRSPTTSNMGWVW